MQSALNVVSILGSVREGRLGGLVASYVNHVVQERGHNLTFVDCAQPQYQLPLLTKRVMDYADPSEVPANLRHLQELFTAADAFLLVTPEYNQHAAPALTNMLDHFVSEYRRKVVGIVSYSVGTGGGRLAADSLRLTMANLGACPNPFTLNWPQLSADGFDAQGKPTQRMGAAIANAFMDDFEWYGRVFKRASAKDRTRN